MAAFVTASLRLLNVVLLLLFSVLIPVKSTVLICFHHGPQAQSRSSDAVFHYTIERPDGTNACKLAGCSIHCKLDGQTLRPCPTSVISLSNLSVNHEHKLYLNVTTGEGERNSSVYSWFIDATPPTATISSERNYTAAEKVNVEVMFSEPCTGKGGFKCVNSSNCDVITYGPAHIITSSLQMIKPGVKYSFEVSISPTKIYGWVLLRLADKLCTDRAGNEFTRTNGSATIIHFDRRPVQVDLWTPIPSYALALNGVPRTILSTNKEEGLVIYLDFSIPILNTSQQVLKALHVNSGSLVAYSRRSQGNRRYTFELKNMSGTQIVTVKFQAGLVIGRTGSPVSSSPSITFLYDSQKPSVKLSTSTPDVRKQQSIQVIVEFTKPVFGFEASMVQVDGGRIVRFKELSRALFLVSLLAESEKVMSLAIPEGKVKDISGNLNRASNNLEVNHYSTPEVSDVLQSFVTVGILATSLAACLLSLSSSNLGAISSIGSESSYYAYPNPSMNLQGMIGHLQVFVLSDWISVNQPIEYSETMRGLRWLIPHHKLPWEKKRDSSSVIRDFKRSFMGFSIQHPISSNFTITCALQNNGPLPVEADSTASTMRRLHNISIEDNTYGLPLSPKEYFQYFLKGEPLSATYIVKRMEKDDGWENLKMNLFWLAVGGGSLIAAHFLILLFLKLRMAKPACGILSIPRFELFLLILLLPCILQSSAFVLKGGTTMGIIMGTFLLTISSALVLCSSVFLSVVIFSGTCLQYKEIRERSKKYPWHKKFWFFITGTPTFGKWYYREELPSTFLLRFGILFENLKGPPLYIFSDQNDASSVPRRTENSQTGIGRMRAISSDDIYDEMKIPKSKWLLGCARSSYVIVDLLRRITLGFISGLHSWDESKRSIIALLITLLQCVMLFATKPYISRGVHVVEGLSLLCEASIFGLLIISYDSNSMERKSLGWTMLALFIVSFLSQIVNEWYALAKFLLRFSQPQKNSFKLGCRFVAKGLVFPFLPRRCWVRFLHGSSQPKTGLAPLHPLSPDIGAERRERRVPCVEPLSSMTATVVPVHSPDAPGLNDPQTSQRAEERFLKGKRAAEEKQVRGLKIEPKSEMKQLRELAKASFPGH